MEVPKQIIFLDKFFRDVREFDASVFRMGEMGLEVFFKMLKLENRAPGQEMMLLETNLTVSREPVLVFAFPG